MNAPFTIGVDLGGTHVRAGCVSKDGRLEHHLKRASAATEGPDAPIEAIAAMVSELEATAGSRATAIGIGSPGMVDPKSGAMIGTTPHLRHWEDFPLRERLTARLEREVRVDNDANLAALGEYHVGAGRGARTFVMITVGTGVGCGVVAQGILLRGANGGAGEIGHLALGNGGSTCRCGVEGCIEPEMSGSGIEARARSRELSYADAESLFAAATNGEAAALDYARRFGEHLARTIGVAVNLLNPDVVAIGGGVAAAGDALLAPVRSALGRYALESHRRALRVVPAELGERAGVIGGGLLAWEGAGGPQV
jgi:glucokinase